mmetsp:Transcript_3378/g.9404  ORF Transcript_3378/g.9404 Transcript_3378/m.9404 type:complete len:203 (+) Transcript_3378:662-1270(+)
MANGMMQAIPPRRIPRHWQQQHQQHHHQRQQQQHQRRRQHSYAMHGWRIPSCPREGRTCNSRGPCRCWTISFSFICNANNNNRCSRCRCWRLRINNTTNRRTTRKRRAVMLAKKKLSPTRPVLGSVPFEILWCTAETTTTTTTTMTMTTSMTPSVASMLGDPTGANNTWPPPAWPLECAGSPRSGRWSRSIPSTTRSITTTT